MSLNHKICRKTVLILLFLIAVSGLESFSEQPPDEKKRAFCEMLLGNLFDDIQTIQDKYPELKSMKRNENLQGLKLLYCSDAEFTADKASGREKWVMGKLGCVIEVRFYFGGYNWDDLKIENNSNLIFSLLTRIDVNIQAKILSRNSELRSEVEKLIRSRLKDLM